MVDRSIVRELYAEAAELPADQVAAFLDRACGPDAELRREVESLLAAAAQRPQFLGAPTAAPPGMPAGPGEQAGSTIGRYHLLQEIGQGGFGQVFMAEQREPVRRMVALKVIKLGMDTKQVVARFEQERQALAIMDHPNIASVFDAGVTDSGRPYFVMELVRGLPITKFCDEQRLTMRERIDLFVTVCHAVQHAHQKGIIHRDIKPGNVLVTLHDGRPVPKVIDFGIAKAMHGRLTEKTLFTEMSQFVGTPAYMSPEQAEMSGLDIDTRSDVYSLGVLLYELVTGTTPFTDRELLEKGYAEIQRVIREVEPPRPSTRVSSQRDTIASVAAQRRADPTRLPALLRGEVDWMVMKCLEKDRRRRYDTVDALCADLVAYAEGREVTAVPPSAAYRARKFVSRNRGLVTAGGIVLATLLLGVTGTAIGLVRARESRTEAIKNATLADANAKKAGEEATRADAQAAEALASARAAEAVNELMRSMIGRANRAKEEGRTDVTVREVMDAAAADLESGATTREPRVATTLAKTIAETYRELNLLEPAERMMRLYHRLTGEHFGQKSFERAESANTLGGVLKKRGNLAEAREFYALARAIAAELGDRGVELGAASVVNEAVIDAETGNLEKAQSDLQSALTLLESKGLAGSSIAVTATNNLAVILWNSGKRSEAQEVYSRFLELLRGRGREPERAEMLRTLAVFQSAQREFVAAEKSAEEEVAICRKLYGDRHLRLASALEGYSLVLRACSKSKEAIAAGREAVAIYRALLAPKHTSLVASLGKLGMVLVDAGEFAEAEPILREECELSATLMPPGDPGFVNARYLHARALFQLGRVSEAEPILRQALADSEATMPEGNRHWWMRGASGCLLAGVVADIAEKTADPVERLRRTEEATALVSTYADRLLGVKNEMGPRNSRMVIVSSLDQVVAACEVAARVAPSAEREAAVTTWRARRDEFIAGLAK
ncbi:MAG: protein kinase domain-containing protein [Phycisphaerales bacterium]